LKPFGGVAEVVDSVVESMLKGSAEIQQERGGKFFIMCRRKITTNGR
jgi:hypothetical protein